MISLILFSCEKKHDSNATINETDISTDSIKIETPLAAPTEVLKEYSNERFKNVIIEKMSDDQYRVKGKAQIFEASFNWTVEDGHYILKEGIATTDAGAPVWGDFDFIVDVEKKTSNSTLNLILFEKSAKDGSIQFELMMPLP